MMASMGGAEFDEVEVTEDEFDQMLAAAEPASIFVLPPRARPHTLEDYYTLSVTTAIAVAATAGPWGAGPQWHPESDPAVPSRA